MLIVFEFLNGTFLFADPRKLRLYFKHFFIESLIFFVASLLQYEIVYHYACEFNLGM